MERTRRILMTAVWVSIVVALALAVVFETGMLLPGYCAGDVKMAFFILSMMEILTICAIPLALRLFRFRKVNAALLAGHEHSLLFWGGVRLAMICVPMVANTLFYYLFDLKPAFGYMGIICLICLVFIYPSKSRCLQETGKEE